MTSPNLPGEGIDGTGASNPNASQLGIGRCHHGTQHMLDARQRLCIAALRIRRTFHARQHMAVIIYHSNRDFCAADVNCTNHVYSFPVEFYFHSTIAAS